MGTPMLDEALPPDVRCILWLAVTILSFSVKPCDPQNESEATDFNVGCLLRGPIGRFATVL